MTAADIKKFDLISARIELADIVFRGRPISVARYRNPSNGQCFDLFEEGGYYRETPIPASEWDIVAFGEFKPLAN